MPSKKKMLGKKSAGKKAVAKKAVAKKPVKKAVKAKVGKAVSVFNKAKGAPYSAKLLSTVKDLGVANWIGAGFNIYGKYDLTGSAKDVAVFDSSNTGAIETDIGKIPDYCQYRPDPQVSYFEATGESRESFQKKFAAKASVDVNVGAFSGHMSAAFSESSTNSARYFYACRAYVDLMGTVVQTKFADKFLSDDFKYDLGELPAAHTDANLSQFADFFDKWGAYFVSKVSLGNTMEYYVSLDQRSQLGERDFKAKVTMEYDGLFTSGEASAEMREKSKWSSYQENRAVKSVIKGGDKTKAAKLVTPPVNNFDQFGETKSAFTKWVDSTKENPAFVDFGLKPIWEVCGAKRKSVENAFREYGRRMRPLVELRAECTRLMSVRPPAPGFQLNGLAIPTPDGIIPPTQAGFQVVMLDRKNPTSGGIKFNQIFQWRDDQRMDVHNIMNEAADTIKRSPHYKVDNFFLLATFGQASSNPSPKLATLLRECGGGNGLESWINKESGGYGTLDNSRCILYALAGWPSSGTANGVEVYGQKNVTQDTRPARLSVYFYFLGAGRPYALGQADVALARSANKKKALRAKA